MTVDTKGVKKGLHANGVSVAFVIAGLLLAFSAVAKPIPPSEGCRPISKIEYNAAKREYLCGRRLLGQSPEVREVPTSGRWFRRGLHLFAEGSL
jgi:hypothetical protein